MISKAEKKLAHQPNDYLDTFIALQVYIMSLCIRP